MVVLTERDKTRIRKLPKRLRPFVGPQGVAGERGEPGTKGNTGAGTPGKLGPQGKPGSKGETGSQGELGPEGNTGTEGKTGETGAKGKQGIKGSTGEKGTKGDRGSTGVAGAKGDKGEIGERGRDGLDGFDGKPGRPGDKGEKGDRGPQGERGSMGDEGPPSERTKELSKRDRERIINEVARTLPYPGPGVAISPGAAFGAGVIQLTNISKATTLAGGTQVILCDASSASFTVTLPTASSAQGRVYHIKKTDNSGNAVTVSGGGATIDGETTQVINVQYDSMMTISDGDNWHII